MRLLRGASDKLQVITGSVGQILPTVDCMYVDASTPPNVQPIPNFQSLAAITAATTTTLVDATGITSGWAYNVKNLTLFNGSGSVANAISVVISDGTNTSTQWAGTLQIGESVVLDELGGWTHYDASGNPYATGVPLSTIGDVLTYGAAPARLGAGGNGTVLMCDSTQPTGNKFAFPVSTNTSSATVSAGYATDTYLAGSAIAMPDDGPVAGAIYRCRFDMVKTGAGTAAFTINLRYGTNGTTADTSLASFAFTAGSTAADTGMIEVDVHFRSVGSGTAAVVVATAAIKHQLAATGLTTQGTGGYAQITDISSGFNSTPAGSILGISVNGGTSFSGTNNLVQAEAFKMS